MPLTPIVTFHGIRPSASLEADIQKRVGKLETFDRSIVGCRVVIELAERHHERGNRYHVRIDLTVPGAEIIVSHEASPGLDGPLDDAERIRKGHEMDPERKDAHLAVREAFVVARRRLRERARRQKERKGPAQPRMTT